MINIKDNAKIMAELLRSGHTMLNLACPECNNPLFRNKNNEIYCPICKKQVLIKSNDNKIQDSSKKKAPNTKNLLEGKSELIIDFVSVKKILENKIIWLFGKLENEAQLDLIERYLNILEKLFGFLNKIRDNNASAGI